MASGTLYSTLMAYTGGSYYTDADDPYKNVTSTEIYYFSNPSVNYGGVATGVASLNDNARTLRETKHYVAGYRGGLAPVILRFPVHGANVPYDKIRLVWFKVTGATKYQYQVFKADWSLHASGTLGDVESVLESGFPGDGSLYRWRVRAGNASGWGPFSRLRAFWNGSTTFVPFNHQFGIGYDGYNGWKRVPGEAYWHLISDAMYTAGEQFKWHSAYNGTNTYNDLDFSVNMKRWYSDSDANAIVIRAGSNFSGSNLYWHPGYTFQYSNTGHYSIWRRNADGTATALQSWTLTFAVNPYGWNVLRVRAVGSTFHYYINGTLVATVTDSTFSGGFVGVVMFRGSDEGTTWLDVEWAQMQAPTSAPPADTISPEQQALNEKAMQ